MLSRLTGRRKALGALVGGLAALLVGAVLVLVVGVGRPAVPAEAAAGKAHEAASARPGADALFGPTFTVTDRIVNLADPGGRRYLRYTVALELAPHEGAKPVPAKDADKAFQARMKKYGYAIEETVVLVLSSTTYAEITSPAGKDAAKRAIKDRVQELLGDAEHVTNVYVPELVAQ